MNIFTCTIHAENTRNEFYRTLSIQGTNFIECRAYWEPISSHAEHARKCLKVEYLELNTIFKNLVLQALGTIRFRFLQKKYFKKISCSVYLKKNISTSFTVYSQILRGKEWSAFWRVYKKGYILMANAMIHARTSSKYKLWNIYMYLCSNSRWHKLLMTIQQS